MKIERCSGVGLHPTSLPSRHGIGSLGWGAMRFVDFLADAAQRLWQVCPLGPTGFGDSPYQCFSAFAGNPLLIDVELLCEQGWLSRADLSSLEPPFDDQCVDFGRVVPHKWALLRRAHATFHSAAGATHDQFGQFCQQQAGWLDDFALFMALKSINEQRSWQEWPEEQRLRQPEALNRLSRELSVEIELHKLVQFFFFGQWEAVKRRANAKGIRIIGDVPIFVALDSADVWARRDLFQLDSLGKPTAVAGVPPDYFSETGQLWGNPLYDWPAHQQDDFRWWVDVIRSKLRLYDVLRIDHFRGFAAYWSVAPDQTTAIAGRWTPGPGAVFFEALHERLGDLPLIAEDLGVITPDVVELREQFGFPGMKILQFAFDSLEGSEFRPHTYPFNCVAYTGTHDNDTVLGWFNQARDGDKAYALEYLHSDGTDVAWDFVRTCWASPANIAMAPLQDILGLGSEARMNTPATLGGNWDWRFTEDALSPGLADRLRRLSEVYVRSGDPLNKSPAHARLTSP